MRKIFGAMVAASALVVALPVASAEAATAHHVLTIRRVGGPAVTVGAVLKASLKRGTTAVFSMGSMKLICRSASFTAKVTSNPRAPGAARELITAQKVSRCTVSGSPVPVTVKSTRALNLPYKVKVSDATGKPVTVKGHTSTKPLKFSATVDAGVFGQFTCTYAAASIAGKASNTGSTIKVSMQKFTFVSGSPSCQPTALFSATFGPVRDFSVPLHPRVFVN